MGLFEELAGGRFRWPGIDSTVNKIVLSHEELTLLLGGIDLKQTSRGAWYRRKTDASPSQFSPVTSRPSPCSRRAKCQPASGFSARSEWSVPAL